MGVSIIARVWRSPCLSVLVGVAACLASASCAPDEDGFIEAEGLWADGEAIKFEAPAKAFRSSSGRVDLRARAGRRQRFLGVRLSYDDTQLLAPGVYQVDPKALGKLELYCARPVVETEDAIIYDVLEQEVNAGEIAIESLPGVSGRLFAGTFKDVVLERIDQPLLRLTQGRFRGWLR